MAGENYLLPDAMEIVETESPMGHTNESCRENICICEKRNFYIDERERLYGRNNNIFGNLFFSITNFCSTWY